MSSYEMRLAVEAAGIILLMITLNNYLLYAHSHGWEMWPFLLFWLSSCVGFKLNNRLNQILVARYAENEMIDFDNFICCLVKLESMFSEYYYDRRHSICMLYVFRLLSIDKLSNRFTGYFQQFDKEGSGQAEMNITEVSFAFKKKISVHCVNHFSTSNFCFSYG